MSTPRAQAARSGRQAGVGAGGGGGIGNNVFKFRHKT